MAPEGIFALTIKIFRAPLRGNRASICSLGIPVAYSQCIESGGGGAGLTKPGPSHMAV